MIFYVFAETDDQGEPTGYMYISDNLNDENYDDCVIIGRIRAQNNWAFAQEIAEKFFSPKNSNGGWAASTFGNPLVDAEGLYSEFILAENDRYAYEAANPRYDRPWTEHKTKIMGDWERSK